MKNAKLFIALTALIATPALAQDESAPSVRDLFKKPPTAAEGEVTEDGTITYQPWNRDPSFRGDGVGQVDEVERPTWNSRPLGGALLRGLDKVSGRITDVSVPVGETTVIYDRLEITVNQCRMPPPEAPSDAFAHLTMKDRKHRDALAFQGWMFASSPALSAMDHQRYDVWVLTCITS